MKIGFCSPERAIFVTDTLIGHADGSTTVGDIEFDEHEWVWVYDKGSNEFTIRLELFPVKYQADLETIVCWF